MIKFHINTFEVASTIASIHIPKANSSESRSEIYNLAEGLALMDKIRWKIECINHHIDINETGHNNMLKQTHEIAESIRKLSKSINRNTIDPQLHEKINALQEAVEISSHYKETAAKHANFLKSFDENRVALRKLMSALDEDYESQVFISNEYKNIETKIKRLAEKLSRFNLD